LAEAIKAKISDRQSNLQIFKDFSSNLIGSLSGGMFSFGMGLMLLNQTHLALSFGLSTIIGPIVSLLLLVPMGNIVDRYPHKRILICSNLVRIIGLGLFAWFLPLFFGISKLIPVVVYSILDYICSDFSSTAYSSAVHELVNEQKIQKLSSLTSTASSISTIFSPMLGLALYSLVGFEAFIFIEMLSSVLSFLIMLTMKFHYEKPTALLQSQHPTKDQFKMFRTGIAYIKRRPLIKEIILVAVMLNFTFTSLTVGIPFVINDTLHLGNAPISWLETGNAIGVLTGSLLMSWQPKAQSFKRQLILPLLVDNGLLMLLGFIFMLWPTTFGVSFAGTILMIILGFSIVIPNISMQVELQKSVPTNFLGRVQATLMTINSLTMPLGVLVYTLLFQGIQQNYWIFIISGMISLLYMLLLIPKITQALKQENLV
jgi:MFS family permease